MYMNLGCYSFPPTRVRSSPPASLFHPVSPITHQEEEELENVQEQVDDV